MMYLDNITLDGSTEEIVQDLEVVKSLAEIGLCLNNHKSKIISNDQVPSETINVM